MTTTQLLRYPPAAIRDYATRLWPHVRPLLPPQTRRPQSGGRPRSQGPDALEVVLHVLLNRTGWRSLPDDAAISGPTAHRRWQEWVAADLWPRLHAATHPDGIPLPQVGDLAHQVCILAAIRSNRPWPQRALRAAVPA